MRRPPILVLALVACCLAGPQTAYAHTPPSIYLTVGIDDEEVTWELTVSASILEDWLPIEAKTLGDIEGDALAEVRKHLETFVAKYAGVAIDRIPVRGVFRSAKYQTYQDHGVDWEYVQIRFGFATKGAPRTVALTWTNYDGGLGGYYTAVESEIAGYGETSYYHFRDREPEYVWHAPRTPRTPVTVTLPPVVEPDTITVPLVSATVILVLLLALIVLRARGAGRRPTAAVVVLGIGLALGFSGTAHTQVELPWQPAPERPDEAEAKVVFESLLRNIYRAFDYDNEDDVYDTLARSVTGDLLDDIYAEVYESLVLQEAGGAVSKVQKVDIEEMTVVYPDDDNAPWFSVRAQWRVHGKVAHGVSWLHTHMRINQYEAIYTMTLADGAWRIAKTEVLKQERIDDGSPGGG